MTNSISFDNKDSHQAEVKNRAEQGNQSYDERDLEVAFKPRQNDDDEVGDHSNDPPPSSSDHLKVAFKPRQNDDEVGDHSNDPPPSSSDHLKVAFKPRQNDDEIVDHSNDPPPSGSGDFQIKKYPKNWRKNSLLLIALCSLCLCGLFIWVIYFLEVPR